MVQRSAPHVPLTPHSPAKLPHEPPPPESTGSGPASGGGGGTYASTGSGSGPESTGPGPPESIGAEPVRVAVKSHVDPITSHVPVIVPEPTVPRHVPGTPPAVVPLHIAWLPDTLPLVPRAPSQSNVVEHPDCEMRQTSAPHPPVMPQVPATSEHVVLWP